MGKKTALRLAAIPAFVMATAGSAMAALPTEATTAIGDYKTDGTTTLGLLLGAGVALWGLKKLGQKFGWL